MVKVVFWINDPSKRGRFHQHWEKLCWNAANWRPCSKKCLSILLRAYFCQKWGSEICFFCSLIFGSSWALHGMCSYAIPARRRSPNTLFRFRTFSRKSLPKDFLLDPLWSHVLVKLQFLLKKRVPRIASKKGYPPIANKQLWTSREAPWQPPLRARFS